MASLSEIIAAREDLDLQSRIIAACQEVGLDSTWAQQHMGSLVTTPVDGDSTLADVYAYAASTRPLPPGLNPGACTDVQIRAVVAALKADGQA